MAARENWLFVLADDSRPRISDVVSGATTSAVRGVLIEYAFLRDAAGGITYFSDGTLADFTTALIGAGKEIGWHLRPPDDVIRDEDALRAWTEDVAKRAVDASPGGRAAMVYLDGGEPGTFGGDDDGLARRLRLIHMYHRAFTLRARNGSAMIPGVRHVLSAIPFEARPFITGFGVTDQHQIGTEYILGNRVPALQRLSGSVFAWETLWLGWVGDSLKSRVFAECERAPLGDYALAYAVSKQYGWHMMWRTSIGFLAGLDDSATSSTAWRLLAGA